MAESVRAELFARLREQETSVAPEQIARALAALGHAQPARATHTDLHTAFLANVLANKGTVELARDRGDALAGWWCAAAIRSG